MTEACIVGWAHTPFGKLDDPDVGKPDRPRRPRGDRGCRGRARRHRRHLRRPVQQRLLQAGLSRLAGAAARPGTALQAGHPRSRTPAPPAPPPCMARASCSAPGAAGSPWCIGVEKMTATPGPQVGDILLTASYRRRKAKSRPVSPACSAASPSAISSAMATSRTRWRRSRRRTTRMASTTRYAQMRKDLGYDFCRTVVGKEPLRRAAAEAHRLLAGLATAPPRWCWRTKKPPTRSARRCDSAPPCRSTISCRSVTRDIDRCSRARRWPGRRALARGRHRTGRTILRRNA